VQSCPGRSCTATATKRSLTALSTGLSRRHHHARRVLRSSRYAVATWSNGTSALLKADDYHTASPGPGPLRSQPVNTLPPSVPKRSAWLQRARAEHPWLSSVAFGLALFAFGLLLPWTNRDGTLVASALILGCAAAISLGFKWRHEERSARAIDRGCSPQRT
jgi:hypothetical protein